VLWLGTVAVTPEPPETATGAVTAVVTAVVQAWFELVADAFDCAPLTEVACCGLALVPARAK
jgi:hypothetical protein